MIGLRPMRFAQGLFAALRVTDVGGTQSDPSTTRQTALVTGAVGLERGDFGLDQADEFLHAGRIENQAGTGAAEEIGQWRGAAQCQCGAIVGGRLRLVLQAIAPDLQRTQLRDGIFDVVERVSYTKYTCTSAQKPYGINVS